MEDKDTKIATLKNKLQYLEKFKSDIGAQIALLQDQLNQLMHGTD